MSLKAASQRGISFLCGRREEVDPHSNVKKTSSQQVFIPMNRPSAACANELGTGGRHKVSYMHQR